MKTYVKSLLIVLIFSLSGCNLDLGERGNGEISTKTFDVDDFSAIELRGGFEIVLIESSSPDVTVTTDDNLMSLIEVNNRGNTLEINAKQRIRPTDGTKVEIRYTNLERIEVAGAAEVNAENVITGRDFELNVSGAGEVDLELDLESLEISFSGAGSLNLSGLVENQQVQVSGAGSYDAAELRSKSCTISISGVGGAKVFATEMIDAQVSGVGGIEYFGDPADVKTNVSGMGSIKAAENEESM